MLFPQPDSPTSAMASPLSSENDTPSTAFATPFAVKKYVRRLSISRSMSSSSPQTRIQRVTQTLSHKVDAEH